LETLELEPIREKKLNVMLVTKEYDEPWELNGSDKGRSNIDLPLIKKPTIVFCDFLRKLVADYHPDFATEEQGKRTKEEFYRKNFIARTLEPLAVPFYPVEISDYAKIYLDAIVDEKREFLRKLLAEAEVLTKDATEKTNHKLDYLMSYCQYLHDEIDGEEYEVEFAVREKWIVKGILDHARDTDKDSILCLHICSPRHVDGVMKLLRSLGVEEILPVELRKKVTFTMTEGEMKTRSLEEILRSMEIKAIPVLKKADAVSEPPYILYCLDADDRVSPFDINMAYDAGFDVVIPYSKVTPEQVRPLVQDAIFSRSPKGIKRTKFFIGGTDLKVAKEILKAFENAIFPPFEAAAILDPKGAYSTAASMVAKVEEAVDKLGLGEMATKKVVVLAGTGPVGKVAATLLGRLGCEVYVTSRSLENATTVVEELREEEGIVAKALKASSPSEVYEAVRDKDVILAAGKAGVRLISEEVLDRLTGVKVVADVNAVEPAGIARLKPKDDLKEIAPGIFGIGALAIGDLKYRLEKKMFIDAKAATIGVFDYRYALENAKKLLSEPKLTEIRVRYDE